MHKLSGWNLDVSTYAGPRYSLFQTTCRRNRTRSVAGHLHREHAAFEAEQCLQECRAEIEGWKWRSCEEKISVIVDRTSPHDEELGDIIQEFRGTTRATKRWKRWSKQMVAVVAVHHQHNGQGQLGACSRMRSEQPRSEDELWR